MVDGDDASASARDGANARDEAVRDEAVRDEAGTRYVFTVTAGRTGTAWLAQFLGANLGLPAVHEMLGIDDFGVRMPDIRVMRSFNERGNDPLVRAFWTGKLAEIAMLPGFIETNHTLAKCGLVENLAVSPIASNSALVVLRRDLVAQVCSYLARGDFRNITINWQWYLAYGYPNVILNPEPFRPLGQMGHGVWYALEMDLRQACYLRLFGEGLRFVEANLEEVTGRQGACALLAALGHSCPDPILPPRRNAGGALEGEVAERVRDLFAALAYDREALVDQYLASGRRLDRPV